MTDHPNNQWAPPSGPPAGPTDFGLLNADAPTGPTTITQTSVARGPKNLGRFGLAAALVVTAGVGGLAVNSALSDPAGAETPGEAFEAFFVAVDNEDLAGALELLPPGERESLVEPTAAVFRQLARLELFDESADTNSLGGFDLTVEGVSYSVEQLDPRLAWVTTTGGTITAGDVDIEQLPLGSAVRDWIDDAEANSGVESFDQSVESAEGDVADLGADPFSLAIVEEDGSWYVSVMYTMAESVRQDSGDAFPGLGNGPAPVGGETPGEAMRGMAEAAIDLDMAGVISYLDPIEMAALYDYSPLFLDDVDAMAAEVRAEMGTITLDRMETRSWDRNGRTMVGVDGFAGSFVGSDPFTGEPITASIDFADDCYAIVYNGESERICLDDVAGATEDPLADDFDYDAMLEEFGVDLSAFEEITFPEQGLTVVERDGRWYLSLVPSMMYPMAETLEQFELEMFEQLADAFGTIVDEGLTGTTFTEIESEIGFDDEMPMGDEPMGEAFPEDFFDEESGFDEDGFPDEYFDDAETTSNFIVTQLIPAGTPADELQSGGFVEEVQVPSLEATFESVWWIDSEIGGLVALRDIQPGETLLVEDFG